MVFFTRRLESWKRREDGAEGHPVSRHANDGVHPLGRDLDGLLHHEMFSGPGYLHAGLHVRAARRADGDGLHARIREHLLSGCERSAAKFRGPTSGHLGHRIEKPTTGIGKTPDSLRLELADHTAADNRDALSALPWLVLSHGDNDVGMDI
jgi:hypothetical protein